MMDSGKRGILEVCCGSFEDAVNAWKAGARRVELNSALHLGGLTPSASCLDLVKKHTGLQVICMVRPRGAGFCYTALQREQMFAEAKELLEHGCDGLAFGFLTETGKIDEENTGRMTELIHRYGKKAVFHRASDCVKDPYAAAEGLIILKTDRILTSGLEEKAWDGIPVIGSLQKRFGDRIEILAGSGINASNALEIMEQTGISQVHSSCRAWMEDPTTTGGKVSYSFGSGIWKDAYDFVSGDLVKEMVELGL